MITPGEEALLIALAAAAILLFNFSILSTVSAAQQEAAQKTAFLRADKTADLILSGTPPQDLKTENTSVQLGGAHHGGEEGERYLEASRFHYSGGRVAQIRVRAW